MLNMSKTIYVHLIDSRGGEVQAEWLSKNSDVQQNDFVPNVDFVLLMKAFPKLFDNRIDLVQNNVNIINRRLKDVGLSSPDVYMTFGELKEINTCSTAVLKVENKCYEYGSKKIEKTGKIPNLWNPGMSNTWYVKIEFVNTQGVPPNSGPVGSSHDNFTLSVISASISCICLTVALVLFFIMRQ